MRGHRPYLVGAAILATFAFAAPAAQADHHIVRITEVQASLPVFGANAEFVEFKMLSGGQGNLSPDLHVDIYGGDGLLNDTIDPADAGSGQSQRTYLLMTPTGEGAHEITADFDLPDTDNIEGAGGAVCLRSTGGFGLIDCVAWGAITNPPPSAGPVAAAPSDGTSIDRRLDRAGCAVTLESGDDTNDSSADFPIQLNETPTPNSATPDVCPNTTITKAPKATTTKRVAKFQFTGTQGSDEFLCKLDSAPFADCESPFQKRVSLGKHTFKVRAAGDPTPDTHRWKVKRRRR
jgi:hypothetical protein